MNCEICRQEIGRDHITQATKVRMRDTVQNKPVEYHRPCWNKTISERLAKEDEYWNKK